MFHKMSYPFTFLQLTIHVTKRWAQNDTVDIDECVGDRHIIKAYSDIEIYVGVMDLCVAQC